MEELEKNESKGEKRGIFGKLFLMLYLGFVSFFITLIIVNPTLTKIQKRLDAIETRLEALESGKEMLQESKKTVYLQDTGRMIEGYPEVSCGQFSVTSYANIEEAQKTPTLLEAMHSQVYFKFSCENENKPYSQANLILPNGEKFEIAVENGKVQVLIPLFEPGIYVLETLSESQELPQYMAFEWSGFEKKEKTGIIMLKAKPMCIPHRFCF